MRIIIAGDTHGRNDRLLELEKMYPDASLFLHTGDWKEEPYRYDHWIGVMGNNDMQKGWQLPLNHIVLADGIRIYLSHGHEYPKPSRLKKLAYAAKKEFCKIAVYGHSHVAEIVEVDDVLILNPGSLYRNRDGRLPSYIVLDLDENNINAKICFL